MQPAEKQSPDDVVLPAAEAASVAAAFSKAWKCWIVLGFVPMVMVLAALYRLLLGASPREDTRLLARNWFIGACILIIVIVPLSFVLRGRYFRRYYQGRAVPPAKYLTGMLIVWGAAVLGGVVATLGILVTGHPMPLLLPAVVTVVFYFTQYPDGRAMTDPTGNAEDPTIYSEPR